MSERTGISWTDSTWNPVTGCTRASAGCDHCYAFALHNARYRANVVQALEHINPATLPNKDRAVTVAQAMRRAGVSLPFSVQYDLPFARVQLMPGRLEEPLKWRKPRRVFVCSMADLFHEDVPDEFIDRVFYTMNRAHQHIFCAERPHPLTFEGQEYEYEAVDCFEARCERHGFNDWTCWQ